jgi:hypothetical protein
MEFDQTEQRRHHQGTVCDAPTEARHRRVFGIQMQGMPVSRQVGEVTHIVFGDSPGIGRHDIADPDVFVARGYQDRSFPILLS